ncbi:site-specific integrase [Muricauda sp. 334s03]|jgi:site-specific recombinase XerD|uniref:Site-specific integrase n=1 Tax=Flagellimonas yonaguniensis TaxID=3031325 RepID=A0ABT5XTK1_9FLAO|nr:site-specific integrase [[Muricauda] yonaguniensis]MDF0714515.1 site-specific integrase [[Muricauda] yonaguniensis]
MRSNFTFSVLFWLYSGRSKNGKAPIYARISVNGKKLNISLKRRIQINHWDSERQRVKNSTIDAKSINQYLDGFYSGLFHSFQQLRIEGKHITPKSVKARFLDEEVENQHFTMKDLVSYHNSNMFPKLHGNTSRLYLTSQKYIFLFLKTKLKLEDIRLDELNYKFILDFENFLRKHKPNHYQKQIGNNAVMKHIQRLRKMVSLAYRLEWIDKDPFRQFKQRLTPTNREYLGSEELQAIEELELQTKRLKTVRDLFVFSCYTGICYTDLMLLTEDNVIMGLDKKYWIITKRQKTHNPVKIPLLKKAMDLIERYKQDSRSVINNTLFPRISNQKMNAYLKEIASEAKIKKNLTFHMARHTFATTVTLTNGVPIETISKMLGHRKLTTTQIYAKVLERKVGEDMEILRSKLEVATKSELKKKANQG